MILASAALNYNHCKESATGKGPHGRSREAAGENCFRCCDRPCCRRITERAILQRLVVGAVETVVPLDDPHAPLTGAAVLLAEQEAVVPPLEPLQLQFQGPVPVTLEALPAEQRLVVGAVLTVVPFAEPQVPLTAAVLLAEHDAVVPPLVPRRTSSTVRRRHRDATDCLFLDQSRHELPGVDRKPAGRKNHSATSWRLSFVGSRWARTEAATS
jgi:hypothetical protein